MWFVVFCWRVQGFVLSITADLFKVSERSLECGLLGSLQTPGVGSQQSSESWADQTFCLQCCTTSLQLTRPGHSNPAAGLNWLQVGLEMQHLSGLCFNGMDILYGVQLVACSDCILHNEFCFLSYPQSNFTAQTVRHCAFPQGI